MTPNKEDYLKCIYEISTLEEKITNKEIAARMHVSPPAVTEMLKKLSSEGFISKENQKGYLLTELGLQQVSDLYRKHRLIEVFLIKNLGYTPEEIHEEAEVLEHTVSDHFIEQLEKLLDYPLYCPHGGTIPKKGQLLNERYHTRLSQIQETGLYTLKRVHDEFALLQHLGQLHLSIGDEIELLGYNPYTQLYHLRIKEKEAQVNPFIAQQLYLEKQDLG